MPKDSSIKKVLVIGSGPIVIGQAADRDLEECGMIHREVIPEKPPKTLYSLTAFGKSIIPVLDSMCNWGIHFLEGLDITPPCGSKL